MSLYKESDMHLQNASVASIRLICNELRPAQALLCHALPSPEMSSDVSGRAANIRPGFKTFHMKLKPRQCIISYETKPGYVSYVSYGFIYLRIGLAYTISAN